MDSLTLQTRLAQALLHALLVVLLVAFFVFSRGLVWWLALLMLLAALPLGGLFGLAVGFFDRGLQPLAAWLQSLTPGITARFLLFFVYLIGYVLIFAGLVSYPLGLIIDDGTLAPTPATDFRLFSMNFVLLLALWSWLDAKLRLGEKLFARLVPVAVAEVTKLLDRTVK